MSDGRSQICMGATFDSHETSIELKKKEMLLQKMLSTEMPSLFKIVYYFTIAQRLQKKNVSQLLL